MGSVRAALAGMENELFIKLQITPSSQLHIF